jgi:Asp-tRNA(Asn)/Glu-tRNA(Gln) amidotransferase A subunit family amidase
MFPLTRPRPDAARLLIPAAVAALALLAPGAASAATVDLSAMTIAQLQTAVKSGTVTCTQVVQDSIDRIATYDATTNAIITINPQALADAAALDARQAAHATLGPAHCVPVVLKDNILTDEVRTTFGSPLFASWTPDEDAPIVRRLRDRGAIVLAKGNLDDFAAAVYGVSEIAGTMHNPYDPTRTTGGSSGGPAASVASGYAPLGIGTDTGGSLRIPAAFNSVVTIRPTIGLVSRTGISPRALTQDTAGPLARTVADAATGLDLIAGTDPTDASTAGADGHIPAGGYAAAVAAPGAARPLAGMRIGVIPQGIPLWGDIQGNVASLEVAVQNRLSALGADVVVMPQSFVDSLDQGFCCTGLLDSGVIGQESRRDLTAFLAGLSPTPPVTSFDALYNGGANAGRYSVPAKEAFDREATVDLGDPQQQADYQTNLDRQDDLRAATQAEFAALDLDAVIYPSANWFPDPIGVEQSGVFTRWSEQTGYPAIGVPMGYGSPSGDAAPSTAKLPASIEFLGLPYTEAKLITIASAYEQAAKVRKAPALTPAPSTPTAGSGSGAGAGGGGTTPAAAAPTDAPSSDPGAATPTPPTPVPPVASAPAAAALGLKLHSASLAGRTLTVRLTLSRGATVTLSLQRGGTVRWTTTRRGVRDGTRTLTLRLARTPAHGRWTLRVRAVAGGKAVTATRAVR